MIRKILLSIQTFLIKFLSLLLKVVSRKHVVIQGPLTFSEDGLYTRANADFLYNDQYKSSYAAGKATQSWGREIRWRAYVVAWAANKGSSLEGDFVECGVNRGGSAMVAASYVNFNKLNKTFYLLDTYYGLDSRYVTDDEKLKGAPVAGRYIECYEEVKETFKNFSNVKLIRGSVPETLSQVDSEKICYLSIDMNNKVPEIAAAEYFWDKLVSGAVIVLDDYGWGGYHMGQKTSFDEFAFKHGVQVLSLPTGQGLILKP